MRSNEATSDFIPPWRRGETVPWRPRRHETPKSTDPAASPSAARVAATLSSVGYAGRHEGAAT